MNNDIFVDDLKEGEGEKRPFPNPVVTFDEAFLHYPGIMENIVRVGFAKPTPIQVLIESESNLPSKTLLFVYNFWLSLSKDLSEFHWPI